MCYTSAKIGEKIGHLGVKTLMVYSCCAGCWPLLASFMMKEWYVSVSGGDVLY